MHDVASTQHEEESYGLLHQVITILDGKELDIACLTAKVEDLISEDENLEFRLKWMILPTVEPTELWNLKPLGA